MVGKVIIAHGFQENRGAWRINAAVAYEPKGSYNNNMVKLSSFVELLNSSNHRGIPRGLGLLARGPGC